MTRSRIWLGIDWERNRFARCVALGLIAACSVNLISIAVGLTAPGDSWWLIGGLLTIVAAIAFALTRRRPG